MALRIKEDMCTGCGACEFECPKSAISMKGAVYAIDPDKCVECTGYFDEPQCVATCPVPKTIVLAF